MFVLGRAGIAAAVGALLLAGCQGEQEPAAAPTAAAPTASASASPSATAAGPGGCPAPTGDAGEVEARSVITPGSSNGLPAATAAGERLVVVGHVLDSGCQPAAGASVHLWHTDARGLYGPSEGACCYYDGTVRSDRQGRFRIDTIRPAQYPVSNAPPAHIHLEVRHPAGSLDTEIVFAGDPGVPTEPGTPGYSPIPLREAGGAERSWQGEATLVLAQ